MKDSLIPVIFVAFGTIPKKLEKMLDEVKIHGKTENVLTTRIVRSTRIVRIV